MANTALDAAVQASLAGWSALWAPSSFLAMPGYLGSLASSALGLFVNNATAAVSTLNYTRDGIQRTNIPVQTDPNGNFKIQVPDAPVSGLTTAPQIGTVT